MTDNRLLHFTIFPTLAAVTKVEQSMPFSALIAKVRHPKVFASKSAMPLLVMWRCGDSRTPAGCLRHEGNIGALSGVALDYDGGLVSLADAATLLAAAGINAVLYSSPSSTVEAPRWRALLPTAVDAEVGAHRTLVGRANALLGNIIAPESFRPAQSYYVGQAQTAAHYDMQAVLGERCIDEAVDITPIIPTSAAAVVAAVTAADADPVLAALRARGLWKREVKPGTHALICPWTGEHTHDDPPGSSATAYLMRNFEGRSHDGFRCLHTSCAVRSLGALLEFLGLRAPPPLTQLQEFEQRWDMHPTLVQDELHGALALGEQYRHLLRYCANIGWLTQAGGGTHWCMDETMHHRSSMKTVADNAALIAPPRSQVSLRSAKFVRGALYLAEAEAVLVCRPEDFDRDPAELNTPAGVIDLRHGTLRAHRADDMFMRCTAVAAANDPPQRFLRFMAEITAGDSALARYLQVALGACLFGASAVPGDHWLQFWHGTGRNGKNTLADVVVHAMGGYAKVVPSSVLLVDERGNRHPTEIANLFGMRMVLSSEIQEGARWNENQIKSLTGDAMISARRMRQDFFEFRRTHRHVVLGNHRPLMTNPDPAMLARMHLVPFAAHFGDDRADPTLPAALLAEAPGILHWLLDGAAGFWEDGRLRKCAAVEAATVAYFESQSTFQQWLDECCIVAADHHTAVSLLYASYRAWKEARGEGVSSTTRFGEELGRRFAQSRIATLNGRRVRGFEGVRVRSDDAAPAPDWNG